MFKPILLYTKHRQTVPILQENENDFILIDFDRIWKYLRIFGKTNTSKLRVKAYYLILKILKPAIILDINWIGRVAIIHHVYSKKNTVKLIAVQHGFYTGGYISTRFPEGRWHKMARSTHFWIWSEYIRAEVIENHANFIVKGNPLYNSYSSFVRPYREIEKVQSILILPTAFEKNETHKLFKLNNLIQKLVAAGYQTYVKLHPMNEICPDLSNVTVLNDVNLYTILYRQEFDLIIADHSTTFLDALFFNNYVSFCNFHNSPDTLYERFLGEFDMELLEDDVTRCISPERVELQVDFLKKLGLNKVYNNSLLSFMN
jgi:hypothetical protein